MKYVIIGILSFLLLISLVTCSSNSSKANKAEQALNSVKVELASTKAQLDSAKTQLTKSEAELASAKTQLTKSEAELASVKAELTQLKSIQEISFGNGLKVFEVSLQKIGGWFPEVSGKVQNTSNLPMKLVYVIVVAYDKDGTLKDMSSTSVSNLYLNEVAEWSVLTDSADSYAVYAFGNR